MSSGYFISEFIKLCIVRVDSRVECVKLRVVVLQHILYVVLQSLCIPFENFQLMLQLRVLKPSYLVISPLLLNVFLYLGPADSSF